MTKKIIESLDKFTHPFASLSLKKVENNTNGRVKNALVLEKKDAVCVTLRDVHTGDLLFVVQHRAPVETHSYGGQTFNPYTIEPIAGHIEDGNSPEETAYREAVEETSLNIKNLKFIGKGFTSPGITTEVHYHYVAEFDSSKVDMEELLSKTHGLENEDESIQIRMIPLQKAYEMVQNGEIYSSHAIIGIFYLYGQLNK